MSQDFKQSIKKPPEAANRKYSLVYLFEGHLSKNNGNWAVDLMALQQGFFPGNLSFSGKLLKDLSKPLYVQSFYDLTTIPWFLVNLSYSTNLIVTGSNINIFFNSLETKVVIM